MSLVKLFFTLAHINFVISLCNTLHGIYKTNLILCANEIYRPNVKQNIIKQNKLTVKYGKL